MTTRMDEVLRLSWAEVSARRIDRHALSNPLRDARPSEIVATMCGAHAQVMSAAELSIGQRLRGVTQTDIRNALWDERSLVKTFENLEPNAQGILRLEFVPITNYAEVNAIEVVEMN